MDIQTYMRNAMAASRAETLSKSDQLSLGEMILKLEAIVSKCDKIGTEEEPTVSLDFEYFFPTGIQSWRGSYSELSLSFAGYRDGNEKPMKVSAFLELLKETVGKEFTGYKGGEFVMSKRTPVWVANYGNSGNTAVIEIVDKGYQVLIMTGYREL